VAGRWPGGRCLTRSKRGIGSLLAGFKKPTLEDRGPFTRAAPLVRTPPGAWRISLLPAGFFSSAHHRG